MDELIAYMKLIGWKETPHGVEHPVSTDLFPTWIAAIKACIDVASET